MLSFPAYMFMRIDGRVHFCVDVLGRVACVYRGLKPCLKLKRVGERVYVGYFSADGKTIIVEHEILEE